MLKEIGMLISSVSEYVKQRTEEIIRVHELETKLRIYTSEDFVTVIAPTLRSLAAAEQKSFGEMYEKYIDDVIVLVFRGCAQDEILDYYEEKLRDEVKR